MHERVRELIAIKKINAIKDFNENLTKKTAVFHCFNFYNLISLIK